MTFLQKKLGEITTIQSGGTPSRSKKEYWKNGNIPWVKISDIKGKYIDTTDEFISEKGLNNSSAKLFPPGTILMTIFATIGEVAILNINATTNQAIAGITIKDQSKVDINYLFYFLKFNTMKFKNAGRGVAQQNINLSILKDVNVPLPPLEEQKRLAIILEHAQGLIHKREITLEKLEALEKTLFNSMFGNPILNEKKWSTDILKNHIVGISSGWSPVCENRSAQPNEWGILKLSAVTKGFYNDSKNKAYVNQPSEKLKEVKVGDLLVTRKNTRELVGACAYVFETRDKLSIPDIIFSIDVPTESQTLDKVYLWKLFNNEIFKRKIQSLATGAAGSMPNISKKKLTELEVPLPPISEQKIFRSIIEKINNYKITYDKSLEKLEGIYQSLLNRTFNGELSKQKVR